jgi:hypothetical protein
MRTPSLVLLLVALFAPASGLAQAPCVGAAPSPCLGLLVVSEFTYEGSGLGGASDEFVEIYNRGAAAVDAGGVEVVYASAASSTLSARATLPPGTIIPPRGYDLTASLGYMGATAPDLSGWSSGFSSVGGAVGLRAGSTLLDLVGWGTPLLYEAAPISTPQPAGGSFERKAHIASTAATMSPGGADELAGNGRDADANSFDFVARFQSQPQSSGSATEPLVTVPVAGPGFLLATALALLGVGAALGRSARTG